MNINAPRYLDTEDLRSWNDVRLLYLDGHISNPQQDLIASRPCNHTF